MDLDSRVRAQRDKIMLLREQISAASVKEMQLLNEKCTLERRFAELRMALDEKQNEVITSAASELARRKGDLEENLKLAHELKVAEDERYTFLSSVLGLLAEYGIWPRVINASALSNTIKHLHDQLQLKIRTSHHLHDQLQLKIRTSHAKISELNSLSQNSAGNGSVDKLRPDCGPLSSHLPVGSTGQQVFALNNNYIAERSLGQMNYLSRHADEDALKNLVLNGGTHNLLNNDNLLKLSPDVEREVGDQVADNSSDRNRANMGSEGRNEDEFYHPLMNHDRVASFASEEYPGIEGFQIIGDATPGGRLLGCGYPVRGTSLCMFQWVRHLLDGTRQYIEGATNPEYVVTADDVDKLIAVECIPMDDQGRQGDLVRLSCRCSLIGSNLHHLRSFTAPIRPISSPIRSNISFMAVHAQAKRSFSSKGEEVASPADLYFESPLKIVEYPDPILRAKNKRIDTFDENLRKLVEEMFDIMYKTDGIGLSAPQVGVNVQLMVFNSVGERGEGEEIVLVNPRVNQYSRKMVPFNEGCLSFPGIYADVKRPEAVKIDAWDITGSRFTFNLTGLPARVFQHEFDHLQGVLFFDRMTDEVLESIRIELQALEKKYEEKTGLQSPERIDTRKQRKAAVGFGKS